jgi:hypothetical protein
MTTYTLNLTPAQVNFASEGSMDTSVVDGVSIQRTGYIEVENSGDRKIAVVVDGETFTDTMQGLTTLGNGDGYLFIS